MEWVNKIQLELLIKRKLPTKECIHIEPERQCFCYIDQKNWPFDNIQMDENFVYFPLVCIQAKYFTVKNNKNPDLTVFVDIITPHIIEHQLVSEQVRCSMKMARLLGKTVHIDNQLVQAAKSFLKTTPHPHCPNRSTYEKHNTGKCPRIALLEEILNISEKHQIPSLCDLAKNKLLQDCESIDDLQNLCNLPMGHIKLDCNPDDLPGLFHCTNSVMIVKNDIQFQCRCKKECISKRAPTSSNHSMWPCGYSCNYDDNSLIVRLFKNIMELERFISKFSSEIKRKQMLYTITTKLQMYNCITQHCECEYLKWFSSFAEYDEEETFLYSAFRLWLDSCIMW